MSNLSWVERVLRLIRNIGLVSENLEALAFKMFKLVSLIYFLFKLAQHH